MEITTKWNILKCIRDDVYLAKNGDKDAYVRLIKAQKHTMYRVAKSILLIEMDVEDAVSETILNAYINIHKLRKNEYFKTWIIRILINECNLILKKRKKEIPLTFDSTSISIDNGIKKDFDIYNAINSLDYDLKVTIILFYFEDMKYCDIAKVLNLKDGTVKSRLSRAKEKLYTILEGDTKQ
ncbi:MAG: sigma-70 family RNA polymerase sigma factor [Paraclostridium sp.]